MEEEVEDAQGDSGEQCLEFTSTTLLSLRAPPSSPSTALRCLTQRQHNNTTAHNAAQYVDHSQASTWLTKKNVE